MVVVKVVRFDKEEKQAIENVIKMIYNLEDEELALLDAHLHDEGNPCCLEDIRHAMKILLSLHIEDEKADRIF